VLSYARKSDQTKSRADSTQVGEVCRDNQSLTMRREALDLDVMDPLSKFMQCYEIWRLELSTWDGMGSPANFANLLSALAREPTDILANGDKYKHQR